MRNSSRALQPIQAFSKLKPDRGGTTFIDPVTYSEVNAQPERVCVNLKTMP